MNLLTPAVTHYRSTFSILLLILVAGLYSYRNMAVEASPEVKVPFVLVSVVLEGVSPEDGARLLVRPLEKELKALRNLDEIEATARESSATIIVKFEAGSMDSSDAVNEVQAAVDRAKGELPADAEEPMVEELTANDFPAITVVLSPIGQTSERSVFRSAQFLKRELEGLPDVLEVNMVGHREEVVETLVDPARLEHYGITSSELINAVLGNNLLVPAGELDTAAGRFSVKVPGLIEDYRDVQGIPIKSTPQGAVTLGDVTDIRRTFKDPDRFTTYSTRPAIMLEVEKRLGANQIDVSRLVRERVAALRDQISPGVEIDYAVDQAGFSESLVQEMRGNIITAMALVMIIVIGALGFRSGLLVGMGVPFSLLMSLIGLIYLGYTFNLMVMFGMMLALGMLIDGAIVVTEFADRRMAEGLDSRTAYFEAVKRMFWPVAASTATTLAAFLPLMFWPGVAGEFMGYLPTTVFWVLAASLLYALFFAPVIGSLLGMTSMDPATRQYLRTLESESPTRLVGHTGRYARLLQSLLRQPLLVAAAVGALLVLVFWAYGRFNSGMMFFAETEEQYGVVAVRAQGNLSVQEQRALVNSVERVVLGVDGVRSTYATSGSGGGGARIRAKDEIGTILVELIDPAKLGRSTHAVFAEIREATSGFAGIIVTADVFEGGPPVGKPVQLQLESVDRDKLLAETRRLRAYIENEIEGVRDVTDSTPLPGIEWQMEVDRARAAQMGVSVIDVGRAVQLVTNGVLIGEYRPDDSDEEVEIRVRYPESARGLQALDTLTVNTPSGPVPVSSFVKRVPSPAVDQVKRVDAIDVLTIETDLEPGYLADDVVRELQAWLRDNPLDPAVAISFRGANEEQEESAAFLGAAFSLALFLMFVLLVTQFNSFYHGLLILSSVVLSTIGVLLGLLIFRDTFSTILTGTGIVALAGIVVNNNIVLIDTFNVVRRQQPELSIEEAVVRACAQRLRPVFLTTATTVLGLLPLALGASVDLLGREIILDGVVASYFKPVASAIVYGLVFATLLTLLFTPVMLVLPSHVRERLQPLFARRRASV